MHSGTLATGVLGERLKPLQVILYGRSGLSLLLFDNRLQNPSKLIPLPPRPWRRHRTSRAAHHATSRSEQWACHSC